MDRRQRKTRQAIFDALISLLEKKSYAKISVQEIINRADIGRSTFYAHFETKDELLRFFCKEIFDHVFSEELSGEKTHDFSLRRKDVESEITHVLYHLNDSRATIKALLKGSSGEFFLQYLKGYLRRVFETVLDRRPSGVPEDYTLNHLACSFAETARWQMNNDQFSPEEVARFFLASTPLEPS